MTRAEYERQTALVHFKTVTEMRKLGYYSARTDESDRAEWQHFAIPPEADRREHQRILAQFKKPRDLKPRLFGGTDT